jgi:hypothetical protein
MSKAGACTNQQNNVLTDGTVVSEWTLEVAFHGATLLSTDSIKNIAGETILMY